MHEQVIKYSRPRSQVRFRHSRAAAWDADAHLRQAGLIAAAARVLQLTDEAHLQLEGVRRERAHLATTLRTEITELAPDLKRSTLDKLSDLLAIQSATGGKHTDQSAAEVAELKAHVLRIVADHLR